MGLVCRWLLAGSLFDLLRGTSVEQLGRMLGLPREVVGHWVALDFLRLNPTEIINISDGKAWVGRGEIGLKLVTENLTFLFGVPTHLSIIVEEGSYSGSFGTRESFGKVVKVLWIFFNLLTAAFSMVALLSL